MTNCRGTVENVDALATTQRPIGAVGSTGTGGNPGPQDFLNVKETPTASL